MIAEDGKKRLTDAADTPRVLRLIQSIPSPKAELFRLWQRAVLFPQISALAIRQRMKYNSRRKGGPAICSISVLRNCCWCWSSRM